MSAFNSYLQWAKRLPHHGDRSSSLSSDKRLSQQSFQASVASAPEVYRKNSVQEDPWRKTSLVHQHLETPEEMLNDFAKSWPLAPHPGALGNQRLPDIHGRMEPSKTEKRTQCSGNLAEDLAKFNQGRKFRMRHRNFANTEQSAHYDKVLKHHQNREKPSKDDTDKKEPGVVIETLLDLKLADHRIISESSELIIRERPKSSSSDLTSVTAESLRAHADLEELPRCEQEEEEKKALDQKCIKWLAGVAKERTENPEKVFLPHLLMS